MVDINKVNWFTFLAGESELECQSLEDAEILKRVCEENHIDCELVYTREWEDEPYYYVKCRDLVTTRYTLEDDDICNCWTVSDYIENHTRDTEQEEIEQEVEEDYLLDINNITFWATNTKEARRLLNKNIDNITDGMTDNEKKAYKLGIDNAFSIIEQLLENEECHESVQFYNPDVDKTEEYSAEELLNWVKKHSKDFA